jgi:sugar-specific transcriptional regulator TrmB
MSAQDCTNYSAPRPSYQGGVFRAENLGRVLTQDALHNEFAELLNRMQAIIDTFNTRATAAVGQAHTARDSVTALRNDIVARLERLPSEVLTAEVVADLRTQVRAELQSAVAEEVRRQLAARATNP